MMMTRNDLRTRLAELVWSASDGGVAAADTLTGASLFALGVDSLTFLRLIDAVESEYEVEVDIGAMPELPENIDLLIDCLVSSGLRISLHPGAGQ